MGRAPSPADLAPSPAPQVSNAWASLISVTLFDQQKATVVAIVFMVFVMCAAGFFVNLLELPEPLPDIRFTSYWYYTLGLWTNYAIPATDRARPEVQEALARFSFSRWSWEGAPLADAGVLLGMALTLRCVAYVILRNTKNLEFS